MGGWEIVQQRAAARELAGWRTTATFTPAALTPVVVGEKRGQAVNVVGDEVERLEQEDGESERGGGVSTHPQT